MSYHVHGHAIDTFRIFIVSDTQFGDLVLIVSEIGAYFPGKVPVNNRTSVNSKLKSCIFKITDIRCHKLLEVCSGSCLGLRINQIFCLTVIKINRAVDPVIKQTVIQPHIVSNGRFPF